MLDAYDLARLNGFTGDINQFYRQEYLRGGIDAARAAGFTGEESELIAELPAPTTEAAQALLNLLVGPTGPMGPTGPAGEQGPKGDQGPAGEAGQQGEQGPKGDTGLQGEQGHPGLDGQDGRMPSHQVDGQRIRFEMADGQWGQWIDLGYQYQPVSSGVGGSLSIQNFFPDVDSFPATGKAQVLYFDTSVTPYGAYIWDGLQYQQVGGTTTAYTVAVQGKNTTGATIAKGTPVMATGTLGASGIITVAPMDGTDPSSYKYLIGVAAADIAPEATGDVVDIGKVRGFDASAWVEGDVLWISPTTIGAFTNVEPTAGQLKMPVGFVVTNHHTNGEIMVRVTPLDENAFAPSSAGLDWGYYATHWSVEPSQIDTIAAGSVWAYTLGAVTRYRLVPSPYLPTGDAFYQSFSAGILSGLIVTRG